MAAAEMPFSAASFLKSVSQRSKLPVVRQLALCAAAGAGATASSPARGIAATGIQPEAPVHAEIAFRIGMPAVVDDIFTAPGRAGKPGLLMSRQLAYPAAGLAGAIIIDDEFSTG